MSCWLCCVLVATCTVTGMRKTRHLHGTEEGSEVVCLRNTRGDRASLTGMRGRHATGPESSTNLRLTIQTGMCVWYRGVCVYGIDVCVLEVGYPIRRPPKYRAWFGQIFRNYTRAWTHQRDKALNVPYLKYLNK